jgi:hypothetical protein
MDFTPEQDDDFLCRRIVALDFAIFGYRHLLDENGADPVAEREKGSAGG